MALNCFEGSAAVPSWGEKTILPWSIAATCFCNIVIYHPYDYDIAKGETKKRRNIFSTMTSDEKIVR